MNKKELISSLAEKCHLTVAQADQILNATIDIIQTEMVEQRNVSLPGFGNFTIKIREQRNGRNPSTGQEMVIPRAIIPVFKPGSQLKELVNVKDK